MSFRILQIAVPFIWFGALGAISFMEAPLKFTAPNITLELGLGIGRIVFQTLNKIELALAVLLIVSMLARRPAKKFPLYAFGAVLLLLILETFWLLPVLDARAEQVIAGTAAPYSNAHIIYIVFDAAKFLLLAALGISLTKENLKAAPQPTG
jgi:hypothetical protein